MTWATVACEEIHGTRRENRTLDGWDCGVDLKVSANNLEALIAELGNTPAVWPLSGGTNKPKATGVGVRPLGSATGAIGNVILYDEYIVSVTYSDKAMDFVSEEIQPSVEFGLLDFRKFRWGAPNGTPIKEGEAPGRQLIRARLVRTYHNLEGPLSLDLLTLMGHCNDTEYASTLLGLTFPKESLLYECPSLSRKIDVAGNFKWQVALTFNFKAEGWNKFWRAEDEEYQELFIAAASSDTSDPYKNYPPEDLSGLFA